MIIKTIKNIASPFGTIVSGASFRALREKKGYRINSGEYSGTHVQQSSAIVLSDVVRNEDGSMPRGSKYA